MGARRVKAPAANRPPHNHLINRFLAQHLEQRPGSTANLIGRGVG